MEVFLILYLQEVEGIKKLVILSFFFFYILDYGGLFVIDEFDVWLYFNFSRKIIEFFYFFNINKWNVQFIFVFYDFNLLDV